MPLIPQTKSVYRPPTVASKAKPVKPKAKPKPARPVKPAAPKTPYGIQMAPVPSLDAQQQAGVDVWRVLQPMIDAATQSSLRSSEAGMGAIKGYTEQLAKALGGYNPGDIYGRAQQSLQGISENVRASLAGGGQQLAGQLGQALSAINAPAESQAAFAAPQATIGQQAGASQFGLGAADMEAIAKSRAAAENLAAQLPGIAGFTGLQSARALELQRNSALADRIGELTGRAPGMIQDRVSEIRANQRDRRDFNYQVRQDRAKLKADAAQARQDAADRAWERRLAEQAFGLKVVSQNDRVADQSADRSVSAAQKAADRRQKAEQKAIDRRWNARQKALDRAAAAKKDEATRRKARSDAFYTTREAAFESAASAVAAKIPVARIRRALWANYGQALLGRNFTRAEIRRMIEKAIAAAQAVPAAATTKKGSATDKPWNRGGLKNPNGK